MRTIHASFGRPRFIPDGENPLFSAALEIEEAFEVLTNAPMVQTEHGWHIGDAEPGRFSKWCAGYGVTHDFALGTVERLRAGEINP